MNTEEILAAIDAAMADWSISGDAMRMSGGGTQPVEYDVTELMRAAAHGFVSSPLTDPSPTITPTVEGALLSREPAVGSVTWNDQTWEVTDREDLADGTYRYRLRLAADTDGRNVH